MKRHILLLLVLGTLLLGGCCSTCRWRVKHAKPLDGTTWHLVQIEGEDIEPSADKLYMTISKGKIGGYATCNWFNGQFSTEGKSGIRITKLLSTMRHCNKGTVLELKMLSALNRATHYDIDYDTLFLLHEGTIIAVFKSADSLKSTNETKGAEADKAKK